jgi:hypothetical protein
MSKDLGKPNRLTRTQQNALHLYLEHVALELNNAGWTIQKLLEHTIEINWTKNLAKELLWRPVQKMLKDKESTTQLDKIEPSEVYEHLNRYLSEICGIHVPWPSRLPGDIAPTI